jgi:hypothetical protein
MGNCLPGVSRPARRFVEMLRYLPSGESLGRISGLRSRLRDRRRHARQVLREIRRLRLALAVELKLANCSVRRTFQPHQRSRSTLPLRSASARVCSASAVSSAALRMLPVIKLGKLGQPPNAATY